MISRVWTSGLGVQLLQVAFATSALEAVGVLEVRGMVTV
jgi:hypothetical protein